MQEEIFRFLEMENERSKERHDRHKINISKIYELPRVIERYDWEKDDDDELGEAFMAKMNNSNKGGKSVETFNEIKRITRKERRDTMINKILNLKHPLWNKVVLKRQNQCIQLMARMQQQRGNSAQNNFW